MQDSGRTVVLLMGVSGAGKTTVGEALARRMGWRFVDADALHPEHNVRKMAAGLPLDDADRAPWLERVRACIDEALAQKTPLIVACSALKAAYRERLGADDPRILLVSLEGSPALIASRLAHRTHAFMPPTLLESQLTTLEPPHGGLHLDVAHTVDELVEAIRAELT